MQICRLSGNNLSLALDLVWEVFMEFNAPSYSETGIKTFRHFISYENMSQMIENGDMVFYGCYEGNELVGVIAMRQTFHLSLLFVKKEYQNRGVARRLFAVVKKYCAEKQKGKKSSHITVNASPYAVEVYRRLGFSPITGEQLKDGIRYTPMAYQIPSGF